MEVRSLGSSAMVRILALGCLWIGAAASSPAVAAVAVEGEAYGRLLARHVQPGRIDGIPLAVVDYQALRRDPDYARAIADLERARPELLRDKKERFAFWVNAYNLLAIKTVVDHYPIAGIKDVGSFFFPVWKREAGVVGGKPYSLDQIEHGILREEFAEPRVHFALVCASVSCPDLRSEPYRVAALDRQLDEQARGFLANSGKGLRPTDGGRGVRVSSIFKWFARDFAPVGGVASFILKHVDGKTRAQIPGLSDRDIAYLPYDWSLNDRARSR